MGRRFIKRHTQAETSRGGFTSFLPFVSCDLRAVLDQVRRDRVPAPQGKISILFVVQEPLACIQHDQTTAEILLHNLLNTSETPTAVFRHILTHEMLHLVIPGRSIDGKHTSHPPEFFEQEIALAPERDESNTWIRMNFGDFLKDHKTREGFIVKRGWHAIMDTPRASWEQSNEIARRLTVPTGTRKRLLT